MIFVTVGMHSQGFERLIKKMDEIAGKIDEEVIMQIGSTKYQPKNVKYFDFKDFFEMEKLIREARIVVCHGGAGSIIDALSEEKQIIAVPRLKKYNEIIDDHQLELVNALEKEEKITVVFDLEKLEGILTDKIKHPSPNFKKDDSLVKSIKKYIGTLTQP